MSHVNESDILLLDIVEPNTFFSGWSSVSGTYDSDGFYAWSASTSIDGVNVLGEWNQLDSPPEGKFEPGGGERTGCPPPPAN